MRKVAIAVIPAAVLVVALAVVHIWSLDGLDGLVFGAMLNEDTVYARGYSDAAFRAVRPGMSHATVHALLGQPLDHWSISPDASGPDYGERWSRSPQDTNYRCRVVLFRAGRVIRRHSEFYVD